MNLRGSDQRCVHLVLTPHPKSSQYKLAAYVLGPLLLPAGFVAAVVYDDEFREDVDRRFPEIGACVRVMCDDDGPIALLLAALVGVSTHSAPSFSLLHTHPIVYDVQSTRSAGGSASRRTSGGGARTWKRPSSPPNVRYIYAFDCPESAFFSCVFVRAYDFHPGH